MFYNRNKQFPKHDEGLIRTMKNNTLVLGTQYAETQTREDEEQLELYWY